MAAGASHFLLFLSLFITFYASSSPVFAQTCKNNTLSNNIAYTTCSDLPYLNSFLHWKYDNSSNTAHIAYIHTNLTSDRWVAWAVNPTSTRMPGSQAFVAYQHSNGTLRVYTAPVTSYRTTLQEGPLSFNVSDLSATYSNSTITIFATFQVPNNSTTLNQLWQDGPVLNDAPRKHSVSNPNLQTMGTVDLLSTEAAPAPAPTNSGNSGQKKRNICGVLSTLSWGLMMPVGALIVMA